MDLLDLHRFLFSGFVAGERFNERLHCGGKGRRPVAGPNISSGRFACAARRGGIPQYHWPECWKVAAEFRRRRHVSPLLMLVGVALLVYFKHGAVTHFTWANMA